MNLTQHPDDDINMSLSADGRVLAFSSERVNEEYDVWSVYLDENLETLAPAELEDYYKSLAEKVKKAKPIDVPAFAKTRGTVSPLIAGAATKASTKAATGQAVDGPGRLDRFRAAQSTARLHLGRAPKADDDAKPKEKKADKPAPSLDDFAADTAYLRLRRVSRDAGNETNLVLLPDASAVYYTADGTLYKQPWKGERAEAGKAVNLVAAAPDAQSLVFLAGGKGGVQKLPTNARTTVGPEDRLEVDLADQNELKFREMARTLGMLFYSPTMKDTDWPALVERYAPLARAARTPDEFEHVSMKLLGELNASHLGRDRPPTTPAPRRARSADSACARSRSPTVSRCWTSSKPARRDAAKWKLIPGDVVTKLELEPVNKDEVVRFATGRQGRPRGGRDGRARRQHAEPAADAGFLRRDQRFESYDAWRLDNLRLVEKLSDGRLGYIHVRAMDQASLDVFERDLYAAATGKEGLLVDVRNNGGGSTTDLLLASIMYPAPRLHRAARDAAERREESHEFRDGRLPAGPTCSSSGTTCP